MNSSSQFSGTLGLLKFIAHDLNKELEAVNIAQLRICRADGLTSVYTTEGFLKSYDDKVIMDMPMVGVVDDQEDLIALERALLEALAAIHRIESDNQRLRETMFKIIQAKNDGSIDFVSIDDFREVVRVYQQTEPEEGDVEVPDEYIPVFDC